MLCNVVPNQVLDAVASTKTDSVSVSWRLPDGPVTCLKVVCQQLDSSLELIKILSASHTSTYFGGLGSGLEHTLEVYTINGTCESDVVRLMAKTMAAKVKIKEDPKVEESESGFCYTDTSKL